MNDNIFNIALEIFKLQKDICDKVNKRAVLVKILSSQSIRLDTRHTSENMIMAYRILLQKPKKLGFYNKYNKSYVSIA